MFGGVIGEDDTQIAFAVHRLGESITGGVIIPSDATPAEVEAALIEIFVALEETGVMEGKTWHLRVQNESDSVEKID